MRDGIAVAIVVVLLTALTYFIFPGHTYLQQDTQIYLPMLEKLDDPTLFAKELLTSRPHLSWTVYDEIAVGLRRLTGLSFKTILTAEQFLFRALGIWGVFLIGRSMALTRRLALFLAALFSLGATITGPAVLTIEYEPSPRGFAVPLTLLAIGFLLNQRWMPCALAGSVALLYHAPTTAPLWIVFAVLLWRARVWKPVLPVVAAIAALVLFSRLQPGLIERQPMMSTISPVLEGLQRMRASYNWVSLWPKAVLVHYVLLCLISALAIRRLRPRLGHIHLIAFGGLSIIGALSIPVSYATLEVLHWSLIPQFQPARAVLFITAIAIILAGTAAIDAAYERRYSQSFAWFLVPFIIPVHALLTPPYALKDAFLIVILAAAATGAVAVHVLTPRRAAPALAMVALGAFFAVPLVGGVRNYPALWNPSVVDLARWARTSSPRDAVFMFSKAGKDLHPGIFRAEAQRAVYVDWKAGGQVNYFEDLALEWWKRWNETMLHDQTDAELAARGIDYVVLPLTGARSGVPAVYHNADYIVYPLH